MRIFRHKKISPMVVVCGEIFHTESNYSKQGFKTQFEFEYNNFWRGEKNFSAITIYSPGKEKDLYFDEENFDIDGEYTNDDDIYREMMKTVFIINPDRIWIR